jgi:hypothetical protein
MRFKITGTAIIWRTLTCVSTLCHLSSDVVSGFKVDGYLTKIVQCYPHNQVNHAVRSQRLQRPSHLVRLHPMQLGSYSPCHHANLDFHQSWYRNDSAYTNELLILKTSGAFQTTLSRPSRAVTESALISPAAKRRQRGHCQ